MSYQKELMRVEEAYLNKIEWFKGNEVAIKQEWTIKLDHAVKEIKETMQDEISRLTIITNLYKEKLNRRETENRNLLVELKIYKDKVETIRLEFVNEISRLKEELENRRKEWELKQKDYEARIK